MEKLKNRLSTIKISKNIPFLKALLSQCGLFVLSFLFSGISFAGGISPFGIGFLSGVINKYIAAAAIGSAAGYAVFFGFFGALRFITAICLIFLLRLTFEEKAENHKTLFSVLISSGCFFISSLAVYFAVGESSSFIIMCLSEALISGAFTCFTKRTAAVSALQKRGAYFAPTDTIATVFFGSVILLSLERFSVFGFSPVRVLAYFLIMLLALYGKESASSVAGICSALTLGFNEAHPQLMFSFMLLGLTSGLTGVFGKIPIALSLVLSTMLSLILKGNSETAIIAISEAVLSGAIFVFLPEKALSFISRAIIPLSRDIYKEEKGRSLHFMLKRSAKAVKDISASVNAVSELLEKTDKPSTEYLIESVKEDICKGCTKYDFCWNKCADLTEKALRKAHSVLLQNERLLREELPDRLEIVCRMPDRITDSFNRAYYEYLARLVTRKEIFDVKKTAARQFYTLGGLLDDAADGLCTLPDSDPSQAISLMPVFADMGFSVLGISAYTDSFNKSTLQVYCSYVPVLSDTDILLESIFEATGKYYLPPVADEYSKEGTVLSFCEERKYTVEYHTASHTGAGEIFCGDTAQCFFDGTGNFYAVLSDGMGSGGRAAVDSVMTCSLMARLMRAGFSPESALEAVNCAMLVKSAEETLSTLDILKINLETGNTCFYKAGATFSVIKKGEKTLVVEKSSMPLGILKEIAFEKSEILLSAEDTVFIISDGAAVIPHIVYKEIINENKNTSTEKLSDIILNKALEMSPSGKHDDITVISIKLRETQ